MRKYLDANIIFSTKDMSKESWLKKRKEGIGGSDAASVLGLNPYKSSMSVYMSMKNDLEEDEKPNYKMYLGNKLEDFVANEFSIKTGKKVRNVNGILKNDKYPFALGNIDKAVVGEKAFLECYVTSSYSKRLWEKDVPNYCKIQCYHYMAITGATHCYVAVLVGNEDFIIHKLDRDENLINEIMSLEKDFWDKCILGEELPVPDGSDDYFKKLESLYKDSTKKEIILFEKGDLLKRYDDVCEFLKELNSEKKAIEQYFQMQMKDYEVAYVGDRKITWKKQSRNIVDIKRLKKDYPDLVKEYMKTTTSRVFKM